MQSTSTLTILGKRNRSEEPEVVTSLPNVQCKKKTRRHKTLKSNSKRDLCTFDIQDLYIWVTGSKHSYPSHLGADRKHFLKQLERASDDVPHHWILNVNPNTPHWVVASVKPSEKMVYVFDPLSKKLTGALLRQIRRVGYEAESIALKWQDNDWECGYFCFWKLLTLDSSWEWMQSQEVPMPKVFREICELYLLRYRSTEQTKKTAQWGDRLFGIVSGSVLCEKAALVKLKDIELLLQDLYNEMNKAF